MSTRRSPLPMDIRLMNWVSAMLLAGLLVGLVAGVGWWAFRNPAFNLRAIVVEGEISRHNSITLRANVMPKLSGNFFTLDLQQARSAFEAVPWIRMATVHREFPNRLRVVMAEHHPAAVWGETSANTLLNLQGEIFEAELDDESAAQLPHLKGPADQAAAVLHMHQQLAPKLARLDMEIKLLELSPRGSWRVQTETDADIQLGRGTEDEVLKRLDRFLSTLTQVAAQMGRRPASLASADLRHQDGYALRLRGVDTLEPGAKPRPAPVVRKPAPRKP